MFYWLTTLSQPQATLGSSAITVVGALVAVLLGWKLFSAKVRDMRSALSETDALLKAHQSSVEKTLGSIQEKIGGLAASTGQLRAEVSDSQAAGVAEEQETSHDAGNLPDPNDTEVGDFENLVENWVRIRDHLENIASDPDIDGRTAAKYSRIDRRRYLDLVASLNNDRQLGEKGELFLEAANIWASHRTKKKRLKVEVVKRMGDLALLILPER